MAKSTLPHYQYQVGGSLPLDSPSYVERHADQALYEGLTSNQFCYVLSSRQTGKSSLRVRTMFRLRSAGISCAAIDISALGTANVTADEWYAGLADKMADDLGLHDFFDLETWWKSYDTPASVHRLDKFLEDIVLKKIPGRIVIMIDEIDGIIGLNFSSDFFAFIRACYNKRADHPDYTRLTFALIGVATPSDLIRGDHRTPFNIGTPIKLTGFQLDEAQSLASGLSVVADAPRILLKEILSWTGGQPFLTQKVCHLILSAGVHISVGSEAKWVKKLVKTKIINNWQFQDEPEHLKTIQDRILRNDKRKGKLLGLYQQILTRGGIAIYDNSSKIDLLLSGLVIDQQGKLEPYNRIYKQVFDQKWVSTELFNLRPYANSLMGWLNSKLQDKSYLLKGKKLRDALRWSDGKRLSDEDYQFLSASQSLERRKLWRWLVVLLVATPSSFVFGGWLWQQLNSCSNDDIRDDNGECVQVLASFSSGERTLFSLENTDLQLGIKAFEDENYKQSIVFFKNSITEKSSEIYGNPEPQIYLNNARARCQGNPYLIAVSVPIGSSPKMSEEVLRGVADAQEQFNGKFDDEQECSNQVIESDEDGKRLLEIVIVDDQGDQDTAASAALRLSRDSLSRDSKYSGVLGVIGHINSDLSEKALPRYEKAGIAMLSPTSTSTSLSGEIFFRTVPSDKESGEVLATYLEGYLNKKNSKVIVFYDENSTYSKSLKNSFKDAFGKIKIVQEVDLAGHNLDINQKLIEATKNNQIEAALLFPGSDTISLAVEIARANSNLPDDKQLKLLGGDSLYSSTTLESKKAVEGLVLVVPWFPDDFSLYAKTAEERWSGRINWRTASSFDATQALIKTLSNHISKDQVIERLKNICLNSGNESEFPNTSGEVLQFDKEGNRIGFPVLVKVTQEVYDLSLISLDSIETLPEEGKGLVIVAKIGDFYHLRIFNQAGEKIIDKGNGEFALDEMLVQQLEAGLSKELIDNEIKSELSQKLTSSLGSTYPEKFQFQLLEPLQRMKPQKELCDS